VKADQPGVSVNVISVTSTTIKLTLTLTESVGQDPIRIMITDANGRSTSVEMKLTGVPAGRRFGDAGNDIRGAAGDQNTRSNRSRKSIDAAFRVSKASRYSRLVGGQR
jgi:hypothetical protein